jgi:hypothetical protein
MEVGASDEGNSFTVTESQQNGQGHETKEADQNTEPSNADAIFQREASDKDLPGISEDFGATASAIPLPQAKTKAKRPKFKASRSKAKGKS